LRDLKRRQRREGKSLGRLVSDLLARALHHSDFGLASPSSFRWISPPMHAQVNLADKKAVYAALDLQEDGHRRTGHR
jgi:hypothetical protein